MNMKCPHCGQTCDVGSLPVGQAAQCSACSMTFNVVVASDSKSTKKKRGIPFGKCVILAVVGVMAFVAGLFSMTIGWQIDRANMTKVGNNGRTVIQLIISHNLERESLSMRKIWPGFETELIQGCPKDYTVGDSETYFADLITACAAETFGWGEFAFAGAGIPAAVNNLNWRLFAGAGIPAAVSEEQFRSGGHCIWSYIGGFDEGFPDDAPFMFTSNLEITTEDLRELSGSGDDSKNRLRDKLNPNAKPFGAKGVVVVTRGGGVNILRAKDLNSPHLFFGSSKFDGEKNANVKVVRPLVRD